MVKTRMGLLDLRVQTSALHNTLRGARVANVYDAQNGRTYILKLSVPPARVQHTHRKRSASEGNSSSTTTPQMPSQPAPATSWEKRLLLIESGVRVHMTEFDREKDVPSGFCLKLRKHIRTRRLDAIHQLGEGGDRILDFSFSAEGQVCAHLIVEAFSGGNIVLTDSEYMILTLLRTYRITDPDGESRVAAGETYPISTARRPAKIGLDIFRAAVKRAFDNAPDERAIAAATGKGIRKRLQAKCVARKALASELALEPCLLEHALLEAGFDTEISIRDFYTADGLDQVFKSLQELENDLAELVKHGQIRGYIVSRVIEVDGDRKEQYDEFAPYLFMQYRRRPHKEFESFDHAADEFFSSLEAKRAEAAQAKREAAAFKKVDKLASELKGQVTIFENARDLSWERARAIEGNIAEVEAAITVIRSAIAASVPWDGLAKMVEDEKKNGNPVAEIIHSLQLERNEITLMLEDTFGVDEDEKGEVVEDEEGNEEADEEEDEEEQRDEFNGQEYEYNDEDVQHQQPRRKIFESSAETRKVLLVSVDLDLGAHANARRHYEQRRSAAAKMEKAAEATDKTLKAATKKAMNEAQKLEAEAAAASIRARRKALWLEKFYWFVSSENYLVVAGRDAQQNELLVKRYLGPADAYVHADVSGASSVIVKNQKLPGATTYAEIPQITLEQAGTFALCRSAAWDAKIVMSAWWVRASQVSKTTTSGVYLPVGTFSIRGKKNFLNPTQLIMGLAFLFKVDEVCTTNHQDERTVRGLELLQTAMEDTASAALHSEMPLVEEMPASRPVDTSQQVSNNGNTIGKEIDSSSSSEEANTVGGSTVGEIAVQESHSTEEETFDLTEQNLSDNATTGVDAKKTPRSKKRHLSAKERRELRNARNARGFDPGSNCEELVEHKESTPMRDTGKHMKTTMSKNTTSLPRGKKHKLKKMKKYRDQDEEEKRLALTILGSKPVKEQDPNAQRLYSNAFKDNDANERNDVAKTRDSKAGREEQHEVMRLLEEEGIIELARLEEETVKILDMLTAVPIPEDMLQYALPICAPYSALSNYRYKVKLMPGNMKRGKAYRAAVALFIKQAEKDLTKMKQERDTMRLSPENDGIHGMLGNVKIMAPGLAEAQKSLQKNKKNATGTKKSKPKG